MVDHRVRGSVPYLCTRIEVKMLIPENGQWRWNDGPLCNTREEALKTARKVKVNDSNGVVFIDEMTEVFEEIEDDAEEE